MKHPMTQSQLIESYLQEVERRLPKEQREDIIKELSSHIEDQLEYEIEAQAENPIANVLEGMGSPEVVAAAHHQGRPRLIGNELADAYFTAIYVLIAITLCASVLGFFIDSGFTVEISAAKAVTQLLASGFEAVISAIGTMSIIFYLIQRSLNDKAIKGTKATEKWTIKALKPVEKGIKQVSLSDIVTDLVTTSVALIMLNRYTDFIVKPLVIQGSEQMHINLFNPDVFTSFIPFMNVALAASFIFAIIKLVSRQWTEWLRWGEIATAALSLVVMGAMALTPQLLADGSFLGSSEMAKALALKLSDGILISVKITFAVMAVLLIVDILVHLKAIFRNRN